MVPLKIGALLLSFVRILNISSLNTKHTLFMIQSISQYFYSVNKNINYEQSTKKLKKSHGNNRKVIQRFRQGQDDNINKSTNVDYFGALHLKLRS